MVLNDEKTMAFISNVFDDMENVLFENQKRLLAASVSKHLGYGGVTLVSNKTGMARSTILRGVKELDSNDDESDCGNNSNIKIDGKFRIRKEGGGRKKLVEHYPELPKYIDNIIKDSTYGTPEKVLFWTDLSLRDIAEIVRAEYNIPISYNTVSQILEDLNYSKQLNQKMYQVGEIPPDRDAQFSYINNKAISFQKAGEPVISVDTKKKELLGNFKNNGQEYRFKNNPRKVLDHDFPLKELGKIAPYGVYLLNNNTGFVNIGQDHDTPEFAGESVYQWWSIVGKNTFPNATKLYITCDCGGSNGYRTWLWKAQLQELANRTNLEIHVSHYPPGTSEYIAKKQPNAVGQNNPVKSD